MMTGQPGCIKLIHMIAMTSRRGPREVPRLTSSTLGEVVVFVIANSHGITNLLGSLVVGFKFQQEGAMAMRWAATIAKPAVELVKTVVSHSRFSQWGETQGDQFAVRTTASIGYKV